MFLIIFRPRKSYFVRINPSPRSMIPMFRVKLLYDQTLDLKVVDSALGVNLEVRRDLAPRAVRVAYY
jgi:hypothetical protein